ncbi:AbrB/MazE/SpoVT family DNA-binding domain-containing protein [Brevundimonas sp. SL130]|uniref:AbrB/MazE/SpoVT family DNA-binding domain-containing protein n=1 Tax=Brevundimonas sp. SL130 TaxID=2995143 RepID=UPI00226C9877|nr:AbrB/MazE/SpoVT family DNA-binding domain-containing protein [Brevundimonas sp. SL130]WAC61035.1 AbrB/MazE/SpoVT family DNA-binding domain-containing protein [Brevundimonas sp. SL130]
MSSKVRKIGNSAGVILPKPVLAALGVSEGGAVEFVYEPGKVTIVPVKRKVREGWAEDAKLIAAAGLTEEEREWLDADLTGDTDAEALGDDWSDEDIARLEAALAENEREPS